MDESPVMFAFAVARLSSSVSCSSREACWPIGETVRSQAVATSSLDTVAAGEVRVSGVVEVADQALVSPLQSKAVRLVSGPGANER